MSANSFTFNSVGFSDLNVVITNRPRPNAQEPDVGVYPTASGETLTYNRGNKPRILSLQCQFTASDGDTIYDAAGDVTSAIETARDAGEAPLSIDDWSTESYTYARVFTVGEIVVLRSIGVFEITFLIP